MFNYSSDALRRWGEAKEKTGGRLSWIGRFNYTFDQKYIAEFSFRYDGNTLFPEGKRWGFSPQCPPHGVSAKSRLWSRRPDWLSNLKIRASYGTTGNDMDLSKNPVDKVDAFSYLQKVQTG